MKEWAMKYFNFGLSVIPVSSDKLPRIYEGYKYEYQWKKHQTEAIKPNGIFDKAYGIAIVAGVSNVLCFDIDCKYDLTGTMFQDLKKLVNDNCPELLKKMVVQKTKNGGWHFIYRCKELFGNQKLAKRHATEEEKIKHPKEKHKDLIEIRGVGGYFVVYPTIGYEVVYGSFENINEIEPEEQSILFDCAKTFNQVYDVVYEKSENKKIISSNTSPFESWNSTGDVLGLLQAEGWKITMQRGSKNLMLRPGGTGKWSADWDTDKRLFYVFSTSTEFDSEKAYNPTQVLTKIKFNGDYSESAKWLLKNGYGELTQKTKKSYEPEIKIDLTDDKFDFLVSLDEADRYIKQIRDGTFQMGLTTGIPKLDEYFRFKPATVNIFLGHDNVGKSIIVWYLAVLSARLHNWKWAIHHSENKTGGVKRKLIEFYTCTAIKELSDTKYLEAKKWVEEHFLFLAKDDTLTYKEYLLMAEKLVLHNKINSLLLDPYNALFMPKDENRHEWDYSVMSALRTFTEKTECTLFLNCHAVTEALRKKYPKEHEFFGYPMPPDKSDTEGGGKFSNRADNFVTVHRLVQHTERWMITEIHVKKIKEMETGGHHTPMDEPVKLRSLVGTVGFEDMSGFNPITQHTAKQVELNIETRISSPKEKTEKDLNLPF